MQKIIPSNKEAWSRWHHKLHKVLLEDQDMLPYGAGLLVAISGGQDSAALTRLLVDMRVQHRWKMHLWHGNHRWHQDAKSCANHVGKLAKAWKIPITIDETVKDLKSEEEAREWRYEQLKSHAEKMGYTLILTGHTNSDKAETLLFNLARGSGLLGVSSLRETRRLSEQIKIVRPLLSFSRQETKKCCMELGIKFWEDPTNKNNDYSRNLIRNEIMPKLVKLNNQAERHIAQTGKLLEDIEECNREIEKLALQALTIKKDTLDRKYWDKLSPIAQKTLLRRWLIQTCDMPITQAQLKEVWRNTREEKGKRIVQLAGGWEMTLKKEEIQLVKIKESSALKK